MTHTKSAGRTHKPTHTMNIHIESAELPAPGEMIERMIGKYLVLVENTEPPGSTEADRKIEDELVQLNSIVKYVPVDVTNKTSVVRHAAAVYQRNSRTRVGRWTLCSRNNTSEVARRLEQEPLTHVTCTRCRRRLTEEGQLDG